MATDNKYDRQLRLWGSTGQEKLMKANILCIGAGPTTTETLKNLILPGCGVFTLVDSRKVTERDLGNNFFVTFEDIGKSLAEVTVKCLSELNGDVKGKAVVSDIETFIQECSVSEFTIVIASQISFSCACVLEEKCRVVGIPLLYTRNCGMLGYLRISVKDHTIIEGHFDNKVDLRLYEPFPRLVEFCETFDLENLASHDIHQVPFPVILLYAMKKWLSTHETKPKKRDEKDEFVKSVKSLSKEITLDANFEEACEFAYYCYDLTELPNHWNALMERKIELTEKSNVFWFVVKAIQDFYAEHHHLPLSGSLPDMTSSTDNYIKLQQLYYDESLIEEKEIIEKSNKYLQQYNLTCDNSYYDLIRQNILYLSAFTTSSLNDEIHLKNETMDEFYEEGDYSNIPLYWYFLLRGADQYLEKYGSYPNSNSTKKEIEDYQTICQELASHFSTNVKIDEKDITEMLRYHDIELHTTCAIIGGITSQEAIKLITHQFIPGDNTIIYCGMNGSSYNSYSGVYKL